MKQDEYSGFEQGPIRPPSESRSLLIRLTRNCPWNRCTFCAVYKGRTFSLRSVENIIRDIDLLSGHVKAIANEVEKTGGKDMHRINRMFDSLGSNDRTAFNAAWNWFSTGMESIFLQDANSLLMKPDDLVTILDHIKSSFPTVRRITSYARSHTIARIKPHDMERIARAGLDRIHIGLESGSDRVLAMVKKGADKATHIKAGLRVKDAGIELSEYVMPGLGGVGLSEEHARESADALNQINPDFIRLRTLALPSKSLLATSHDQGTFEPCTDLMIARELRLFIDCLDGITSTVKSDHILNLIETVEGQLPREKNAMLAKIDSFIDMAPRDRVIYQVGRRMGMFREPSDMNQAEIVSRVQDVCQSNGITEHNVDSMIHGIMKRFV